MGLLTLGNAGQDAVTEMDTIPCIHCGGIIVQETHYVGGQPIKRTITIKDEATFVEVDEGYYCTKCQGEACYMCGVRATSGLVPDQHLDYQNTTYELIVARR